ncbi:hypothetical protein KCU65_g8436, partial [Aureobasidium melanogenum]
MGNRPRSNPSVLLVLQRATRTSFLHVVPETGDVERLKIAPPAFTYCGTTERSREQIATVPIYSESDHFDEYLEEVATRATKILSEHKTPGPEGHDAFSVEQALRSAVSASVESRANDPPKAGVHSYPVFLVQIDRPKPGKISIYNDFTSFPK